MGRKLENNNNSFVVSQEAKNPQLSQLYVVDVPGDGSCLFWASALAYLSELKCDMDVSSLNEIKFKLACSRLFGEISPSEEDTVIRLINQFQMTQEPLYIYRNPVFQKLIAVFRGRVVDYIAQRSDEFREFIVGDFDNYLKAMRLPSRFGGEPEIRAMVKLLTCSIKIFDIQRDSTVLHPFDPDDKTNSQEQSSEILIQTRILHLFYQATDQHYYFGVEKVSFKNAEEPINKRQSLDNGETNTEVRTTKQVSSGKAGKRNFRTVSNEAEEHPIQASLTIQNLFNSVSEGITVGLFLETAFLMLPVSPLSPLQLVQGSTYFDSFLAEFLDIKRPFTMGILFGAIGGLVKEFLDTDNYQILLVLGAIFSILPVEHRQIENMQLLSRSVLVLFLSGRGLMNTVNFSLPYLTKIPEMAKSFSNKVTHAIPSVSFPFFSKKEKEITEKNDMSSEVSYYHPVNT